MARTGRSLRPWPVLAAALAGPRPALRSALPSTAPQRRPRPGEVKALDQSHTAHPRPRVTGGQARALSTLSALLGCPGHVKTGKCTLWDAPSARAGTEGALLPICLALAPSKEPGHCHLLPSTQLEASVCAAPQRGLGPQGSEVLSQDGFRGTQNTSQASAGGAGQEAPWAQHPRPPPRVGHQGRRRPLVTPYQDFSALLGISRVTSGPRFPLERCSTSLIVREMQIKTK